MTKCTVCKLEMTTAPGCLASHVYCNGKRYERLKVRDIEGSGIGLVSKAFCPDCSAKVGQYHHWGCDLERCPACGLRLLSCDCEDVHIKESDVGK